MRLALVTGLVFLINVLFGYWRANTRRFSIQWIAAIHLPVPLVIVLRLLLLGWSWPQLPLFVAAFAAGQYAGAGIRRFLKGRRPGRLSSCLVMDLIRMARARLPW